MQRGVARLAVATVAGLGAVVSLGASVVLGAGCVAGGSDGSIVVLKNVRAQAGCMVSDAETEDSISSGTLDLLVPSGYLFIAQIQSRITADPGLETQRTIITSGADIDIAFPGSQLFGAAELADLKAAGLTHYKSPFTAVLPPNGGLTDAPLVLIPADLVTRIAARADLTQPFRLAATATFKVVGDMSGLAVSSQAFSYAVTIGNGVSVNVAGACPLPMSFGTPRPGYACNPMQDGTVDCCGSGAAVTCPATVSTL